MVKKKNKKVIGIVGIVLALALLFFVAGDRFLAVTGDLDSAVGQCSGGWTSFSIDDVTVNSQGRIRVMGVAKGSECLSIELKPSELNSYLDDKGLQATKSIIGTIRLKEYTKTFPIDKTGNSFPSIETADIGTFSWCSINTCKDNGYITAFDVFRTGWALSCNCIYTGTNGIEGSFSNARSYGNFQVDFTLDGKTETLNREQQSINIGNHHIEWVGNILNLDEIYAPQYDARLIYSNWNLIEDGAYSNILSKLNSFKSCKSYIQSFETEAGAVDRCRQIYNQEVSVILSDKIETYKSSTSNLVYDATTDANNLYVSLKATPYPAFILDLDAESVGIIALEGKPEITKCISNQDLKSGNNQVVSFSVKNSVDVDNVEFYSSILCNQGASAWSTNFNIGGLQTKTITAEINPVNPNEGTLSGTCKLTVSDLKSGNSDSCQFGIKVTYESGIICTPNSLSCDDNLFNVLKCSSDRKNKAIFENCNYGCVYEGGSAKCSGQPPIPPQGKCESCDAYALNTLTFGLVKSCKPTILQNTVFCMFSFIKLILVPIVFLISLLIGADLFRNFKSIRKNELLIWLFAFLIAGILAVMVYTLFYVGIILTVLFLIIKFGTNFIPGAKLIRRKR